MEAAQTLSTVNSGGSSFSPILKGDWFGSSSHSIASVAWARNRFRLFHRSSRARKLCQPRIVAKKPRRRGFSKNSVDLIEADDRLFQITKDGILQIIGKVLGAEIGMPVVLRRDGLEFACDALGQEEGKPIERMPVSFRRALQVYQADMLFGVSGE